MSTLSRRRFNVFLAAALTQTLITRPTPRHAALGATTHLDALDDLHLANDGTGATANLQKITNAMVSLYQNYGGGEIYFPAGTYAISNQLRPLPNIAFIGADPATTIIKNVYTSTVSGNIYWNASVLFGGHDQPNQNGSYYHPFAATPQAGAKEIQVLDADYQTVRKGDEIKILSATNSMVAGRAEHWPDRMIKVLVVDKKPVGSSRVLYLDRPLPWTLLSGGSSQWGTGPVYTGVPVWMRNQEDINTMPAYWCTNGQYGYNAYKNMGTALGQGNLWVQGWSPRRNTFQNLTLWSLYGQVMYRGMLCDALFDNCIFKGRKGMYGNGCQYTTYNNCTCYFWDQVSELSYNCYKCTFNNFLGVHDATLQPADSPDSLTTTMGTFTIHERSEGFVINGMTLRAPNRTFAGNNSQIVITGDNHDLRHVVLDCPTISGAVVRICKQTSGANGSIPPANVRFRDLQVNMNNHSFGNLFAIQNGSNNLFFGGVRINNATGGNLIMQETGCSNVTYSDMGTLPGSLQLLQHYPNTQAIRCQFTGGITGTYKNDVKVTAGTPNFALYK